MPRRLLILGGTAEAGELARRTIEAFGPEIDVITSLAGRLTPQQIVPGRIRVGDFGGVSGLVGYLHSEAIDAVIDATHPFAEQISQHAAVACNRAGIDRIALVRPPWEAVAGDRWTEVRDMGEAGSLLPRVSRRAFLTVGPGGVDAFAGLDRVWLLVRSFERPASSLPLADYALVVGRPPFTVEGETALLKTHRIDTLVTKQSGGPTHAKLAAARAVGARVIMIRRPPPPPGAAVGSVEAALLWLAARI